MNLSYETKDWFFDNALWIFIGMVAIVMLIGPWWLRRQLRKNPEVKVTTRQSFLISFFAGSFSIISFYGLIFILAILLLAGLRFVVPDSEKLFFVVFSVLYVLVLCVGMRIIIINFSRQIAYCVQPPLPCATAASITPQIPPVLNCKIRPMKEFFSHPLRWNVGWHLMAMCGLCTVIFFFCYTSQIRDKSMEAMFATNVNGLAKSLTLYKSSNDGLYPADLGDLVNGGFGSARMFETSVAEHGSMRFKENEQFKAPSYFHFFKFPENAPSDLLWLWADPEKYLSAKMPAAFFSGETKIIKKKELPALIERSRKWLVENPSATVGK